MQNSHRQPLFLLGLLFLALFWSVDASTAKSRAELESRAKAGDREAMFDHANCLNDPICSGYSQRDVDGAIYWYKKAAEKGQIDAYLMLGMFLCSEPGYINVEKGIKYLDKAIASGLGTMAKPLRDNCGKTGNQGAPPDALISKLLKQYDARNKILGGLQTFRDKEIIGQQDFQEWSTMFRQASDHEIFVYWGFFQDNYESFLNFLESGDCNFVKYWNAVLGGSSLKPDDGASKRFRRCSRDNWKKSLKMNNSKTKLCATIALTKLSDSIRSKVIYGCMDLKGCKMYTGVIVKKYCSKYTND